MDNQNNTASAPTSPLRGRAGSSGITPRLGSLFRPVKSCANLEGMSSPEHTRPEHLPTVKESSPGFISRSLFRSVKSCINLEGMDQSIQRSPMDTTDGIKDGNQSGILFSTLKSFKPKTGGMVSERDINLMAPMSS